MPLMLTVITMRVLQSSEGKHKLLGVISADSSAAAEPLESLPALTSVPGLAVIDPPTRTALGIPIQSRPN